MGRRDDSDEMVMLGRMMTSTSRLEKKVDDLQQTSHEIKVVKKIVVGVLATFVPFLIGGVITLIQGQEKMRSLETQVEENRGELKEMKLDVGDMKTSLKLLEKDIEQRQLNDAMILDQLATISGQIEKKRTRK